MVSWRRSVDPAETTTITPSTNTAQASYRVTNSGVSGPLIPIGTTITFPSAWLTNATRGLAVGVMATSSGGPTFPAIYLGAAGGIEAVFTVLAMRDQIAPPTANLVNVDPKCDLDFVPGVARKMRIRGAMSNSFGFGGTNATLVFRQLD